MEGSGIYEKLDMNRVPSTSEPEMCAMKGECPSAATIWASSNEVGKFDVNSTFVRIWVLSSNSNRILAKVVSKTKCESLLNSDGESSVGKTVKRSPGLIWRIGARKIPASSDLIGIEETTAKESM